jgi:hypothetical protein
MKKFTFLLLIMLAYAGFTMAQTIEDFENIQMNLFSQGSTGALSVVPNPDPTGINTSGYVAKMLRAKDGDPWMGWYATIPIPINVTTNPYVHVKVWKPRVSPTCFKVEGGAGNSGDVFPIAEAAETGKWVEVVFNMSATAATGEYVKIVLIPDFENPLTLTEDITLYFDDMYVNNDPAVGSAPVQVIENFDPITMNLFSQGTTGSLMLVDNPDKSGVNLSNRVCKMLRAKDGDPWMGWYGPVVPAVDVAATRYAHVKVWKPRISPVCFKLEQGTGPNTGDVFSTPVQTTTNAWEDMVFDYGTFTGAFSQIVLIPDFENPLTLTEDFEMYFDDLIFNNDPNPAGPPTQIVQVDMNGAGIVAGDRVFISGALGGIYGTWNEPGSNLNNELFDTDGDGIFTMELHLANGIYPFKFFLNPTWAVGDPVAGGDRNLTVTGDLNNIYTWGVGGFETSIRTNKLAGKIQMYPNPVRNELTVSTTTDIKKVIVTNTLGKVVGNYAFTANKTINTSSLTKGMYFVTFVGADGNKVTQKLIKD